MKKDSFEKKLAGYVAMAAAYLAAQPVEANAQVMYTDVIPDLMIQNGFFNLDLNNDGVVDFKLQNANALPLTGCYGADNIEAIADEIIPFGSNKIEKSTLSNMHPTPVNSGNIIGNSNFFTTNNLLLINTFCEFQNAYYWGYGWIYNTTTFATAHGYCGGANKIIGLSVEVGGNTYYGWARLNVLDSKIILRDYAINSVPDSSIIAGNTGSGCSIVPVSSVPNGEIEICNSDSISINITNPNGYFIQWMKDGQWISGANGTNYADDQFGNYEILVSDSNCYVVFNLVQIAPFNPPNIHIIQNGNYLQSNYNGFNQWYFNSVSNPLIGDTTQFISPTLSGYYFTEGFFPHGCSVFSDTINFIYNSINNIESSEIQFSIESKNLLFHLANNSLLGNQIEIINELGQLVTTVTVSNQNPEADLSALPGGIYFFHIRSKQKTYSGKFFIE